MLEMDLETSKLEALPESSCIMSKLRMIYYSVNDKGILGKKKIRGLLSGVELITSSDELPLSYRRLAGDKAIKLGSRDKHPAHC